MISSSAPAAPTIPIRHRICLGLLCLCFVVPFVQPIHLEPVRSFYSEFAAAALGLLAAGVLLSRRAAWSDLPLPRIAWVPGILIAAVAVQWVSGRILLPDLALLFALYLLWVVMLACLGALLVRDLGSAVVVGALAWALVLGGLLAAGTVLVQFVGWPAPRWLVLADNVPSSNLGQRNHAADYLWLGVVSVGYLGLRRSRVPRTFWALMAALIVAAALTGSRGPLAYGLGLSGLSAWWWWRERTPLAGRAAAMCLAATVAGAVTSGLLSALGSPSGTGQRMTAAALSGDARWTIWRDAVGVFSEAPWLGNGVGNYHWRTFEVAAQTPAGTLALPAEHAHNLILQWLADFGLPVTLVAAGLLGLWAWGVIRRSFDPERWWLLAVAAVLGIHAMLEYPLWYAYFLAPAAIVLGIGDPAAHRLRARSGAAIFVMASLLGVLTLANLLMDHRRLEPSAYWAANPNVPPIQAWAEAVAGLRQVASGSLLSPWADLGLSLAMTPRPDLAAEQAKICRRAMTFRPRPDLVAKCAVLESWTGNERAADKLLREARAAYPNQAAEIDDVIRRWPPH